MISNRTKHILGLVARDKDKSESESDRQTEFVDVGTQLATAIKNIPQNNIEDDSVTPSCSKTYAYFEEEESELLDSDDDPEYLPSDPNVSLSESSDLDATLSTEIKTYQTLVKENSENAAAASSCAKFIRKRKMTTKSNAGRKRSRNVSQWKDVKAKNDLNRGVEHSNRTGKLIAAKSIRQACKTSCRQKCYNRFTDDERKSIFAEFWALGDHTRQWDFIARCVRTVNKKQVTVSTNKVSRRKVSRQYYFNIGNEKRVICKTMFLNTLGISEMYVTTTLKKLSNDNVTVTSDQRGMHSNRGNRINVEVKNSVREHIKLFPLVPSHYIRKDSKRMYLEKGLSIRKMFRLYQEWADEKNINNQATERQYRDIFTSEFNISFHKPKKDQCELCSAYELGDEELKSKLHANYETHLKNKDAVRALKNCDKNLGIIDKTTLVACFDLQKVLITPMSEVSVFYYKSKYATYNFTVYDLGNNKGFCYTWHEKISGRGPHEVSSCVLDFMKLHANKGVKKFIFYSDNCGGQNRNRFLFSMFACASASLKVNIIHRFLEKGHTQNEGDSMHAVIENAKKRQSVIYTPDQWVTLIRMAKTTGQPYEVKEMDQKNFFSTKSLVDKQNWKQDINGNKVTISKIREINFSSASPNTVSFRYSYDGEIKVLNLMKQVKGRPFSLKCQDLPQLHNQFLPIEDKKLQGLLALCKNNNIPSMYHVFYESLVSKRDDSGKKNRKGVMNPKNSTKNNEDKEFFDEEILEIEEEETEDHDIYY